ncbi:hypothetical protein KC622_01810 [Candidatus Dojkabacteria bacterium]|uniref:Uncharacterized protein n=1 Tax=Candidatus Dojkabacteria bacterium TaxID=2099670 RepID=A0A955KUW6_9BACT|nr:hypothetical protein [Candidatus Dojkabacteria bacterium]
MDANGYAKLLERVRGPRTNQLEVEISKCQLLEILLDASEEDLPAMINELRGKLREDLKYAFTELVTEAALIRLYLRFADELSLKVLLLEPEQRLRNNTNFHVANSFGAGGLVTIRSSANQRPIKQSGLKWMLPGESWKDVIGEVVPAFYYDYPYCDLSMPTVESESNIPGLAFIFTRHIDLGNLEFHKHTAELLFESLSEFASLR